jgi:hypothetical protein
MMIYIEYFKDQFYESAESQENIKKFYEKYSERADARTSIDLTKLEEVIHTEWKAISEAESYTDEEA